MVALLLKGPPAQGRQDPGVTPSLSPPSPASPPLSALLPTPPLPPSPPSCTAVNKLLLWLALLFPSAFRNPISFLGGWEGQDQELGSWALGPGPLGHAMSGKLTECQNHDPEQQTHSLERLELDGRVELREAPITHDWTEVHLSCPSGSLKRSPVHPAWSRATGITTQASKRRGDQSSSVSEKHNQLSSPIPTHPDGHAGTAASRFHGIPFTASWY